MSTDIAFRVHVSKNIGIGHLKRLILLQHKLKINPVWIIGGNQKIIQEILSRSNNIYLKEK